MKTLAFLLLFLSLFGSSYSQVGEPLLIKGKEVTNDITQKNVVNDEVKTKYYQLSFISLHNMIIWAEFDNGLECTTLVKMKMPINKKDYTQFSSPMNLLNDICRKYKLEVFSWYEFKEDDLSNRYNYLLIKDTLE